MNTDHSEITAFFLPRAITLVGEIDAPDISAWFAFMRKTPTGRGRMRSERTIQTYARSVRAFFHGLVRREVLERNPFDRLVFPKVGKPLIRTISPEEFERLLVACTPPNEAGPIATRAAVRNRAILWVLLDTGIRSPNCAACASPISTANMGCSPSKARAPRSAALP